MIIDKSILIRWKRMRTEEAKIFYEGKRKLNVEI